MDRQVTSAYLHADTAARATGLAPFSLRDAPALIERVFPAQKVGIEAQKERKAGAGQTLTVLGSYWKGRKPLVFVRACVLASLLPASTDPIKDLEIFESLMAMDQRRMARRKPKVTAAIVWRCPDVPAALKDEHIVIGMKRDAGRTEEGTDGDAPEVAAAPGGGKAQPEIGWRRVDLDHLQPADRRTERARIAAIRNEMRAVAFHSLPFSQQVVVCERTEEVEDLRNPDDPLYRDIWDDVNDHLGTNASTIPELVMELGVARFGHGPVVGDPFCGGGSIPFEAARIGCDAVASDLNPVAAMLTWGALETLRAEPSTRERIINDQRRIIADVEREIAELGIEHNAAGERAKAYLYCLETIDPQTGWMVPMAPTWVISSNRRCIAQLVPDYAAKRFDIVLKDGASAMEFAAAKKGTVTNDGYLVYRLAPVPGEEPQEWRITISRLRGDGEGAVRTDGSRDNRLRPWGIDEFEPRKPVWVANAPSVFPGTSAGAWVGGDVWQERLYAIQWVDAEDLAAGRHHPRSVFRAPDADDLLREHQVSNLVARQLAHWQAAGCIPTLQIERGDKTDEPIRTRGWTHWHHLFTARQLLYLAFVRSQLRSGLDLLYFANVLNFWSRLCGVHPRSEGSGRDTCLDRVFINQALNTLYNYGCRASLYEASNFDVMGFPAAAPTRVIVDVASCTEFKHAADLWIYDPPYADAVHYHEITEYFIAWLSSSSPKPMNRWLWDSRRPLAIQGKGDKFRADMVSALNAMGRRMPDHGLQICMFTHKDAGVWADMAQVVWGAGLQVTAAWYVSTETTSELKQGGYVQGTVLLVLRKRRGDERAYKDEIVPAIRARVEGQVHTLLGLNQQALGKQRDEPPFTRADIQMAGYAAAMEVLTGVSHIDGVDLAREALRPRQAGERSLVEDMLDLAVQTATELMIPAGINEGEWERLMPAERFYLVMTEAEAERREADVGGKLDDYQNFAKAFRAERWEDLMADRTPNDARLKGPADFRRSMMSGHPFAAGLIRPTLYAIYDLRLAAEREEDAAGSADRVVHGLRDFFSVEWVRRRNAVRELAAWFGGIWECRQRADAQAARTLAAIIGSERLA